LLRVDAGGVAHEVNNLVTIVLGQARLARDRPASAAQHLGTIEETARRGGELTARLLVTDVVMPRMGGRELAERLREQTPGLRVLFVSGYSDVALGDAGDPATAFLPKPFTAAELAAAVRGLLEAEQAAAA
jgi:two-component system cell cycle sensor histidine kinase/response regulator CckA